MSQIDTRKLLLVHMGWTPKGVSHQLWSHDFIPLFTDAAGVNIQTAIEASHSVWNREKYAVPNRSIAAERSITSLFELAASGQPLPQIYDVTLRMIIDTLRHVKTNLIVQHIHRVTKVNSVSRALDQYCKAPYPSNNLHNTIGDITTCGPGIIVNGVNCQLVMGSGVAKALYTRYPNVRSQYMNNTNPKLGTVDLVHVDVDTYVANSYTQFYLQHHPQSPLNGRVACPDAIRSCMMTVASKAETDGLSVHLPLVGSDLGGLSWAIDVEPVIVDVALSFPDVNFFIWTLPNK